MELERVLELIVKRGRALVHAQSLSIALREGDELVIRAAAGEFAPGLLGARVPLEGSIGGGVVLRRRPLRLSDVNAQLRFTLHEHVDARGGLVVPLTFRGHAVGVLYAFDRQVAGPEFTRDDELLLESFAASAATAVATAQEFTAHGLRRSIEASERERQRWARELHDQTLQDMAALRVSLSAARRRGTPEAVAQAVDDAVARLGDGIDALRAIITDLRPAALDQLGVKAAIEALVERVRAAPGAPATVELRVDLDAAAGPEPARHDAGVEDAVYRLVQEATTNVLKHAHAGRVDISVVERDGRDRGRACVTTGGASTRARPATASASSACASASRSSAGRSPSARTRAAGRRCTRSCPAGATSQGWRTPPDGVLRIGVGAAVPMACGHGGGSVGATHFERPDHARSRRPQLPGAPVHRRRPGPRAGARGGPGAHRGGRPLPHRHPRGPRRVAGHGVDPFAAAPLTCAGVTTYKAVKVSGADSASLVAVFGAGGLGHMAIQYARITGASVIAVDINEERLATARELGAEHVVHAGEQDPIAAITRLGGLTVKGSIVGTHRDLEEIFELHRRGLTRVLYEERPLEHVNEAVEQVLDGGSPSPRLVVPRRSGPASSVATSPPPRQPDRRSGCRPGPSCSSSSRCSPSCSPWRPSGSSASTSGWWCSASAACAGHAVRARRDHPGRRAPVAGRARHLLRARRADAAHAQTLAEVATGHNSRLVLPIPLDMLDLARTRAATDPAAVATFD